MYESEEECFAAVQEIGGDRQTGARLGLFGGGLGRGDAGAFDQDGVERIAGAAGVYIQPINEEQGVGGQRERGYEDGDAHPAGDHVTQPSMHVLVHDARRVADVAARTQSPSPHA